MPDRVRIDTEARLHPQSRPQLSLIAQLRALETRARPSRRKPNRCSTGAGNCCRASASRVCSTSARRGWSCVPSPATASTIPILKSPCPAAAWSPASVTSPACAACWSRAIAASMPARSSTWGARSCCAQSGAANKLPSCIWRSPAQICGVPRRGFIHGGAISIIWRSVPPACRRTWCRLIDGGRRHTCGPLRLRHHGAGRARRSLRAAALNAATGGARPEEELGGAVMHRWLPWRVSAEHEPNGVRFAREVIAR